jgi:hypothetical protein
MQQQVSLLALSMLTTSVSSDLSFQKVLSSSSSREQLGVALRLEQSLQ